MNWKSRVPISARLKNRRHSRLPRFTIAAAMFAASAFAQSGTPDLKARLLGKTYFLRSLCAANDMRFSADGSLSHQCSSEPFTLGLLTVDSFELKPLEIKIKAHRVGLIFHDDIPQMVDLSFPARGSRPPSVNIRIAIPASGDYTALLAAIFTTSPGDLLPNIPTVWQDFFRACLLTTSLVPVNASNQSTEKQEQPAGHAATQEEIASSQVSPVAKGDSDAIPAAKTATDALDYGVAQAPGKNGVSIPRVIRRRDADLSPEAVSMRFSSATRLKLIVDENGNVSHLRVLRPAGLGLDEQAVSAVAQWKFKPALKDGKPVPVVIMVDERFTVF